MSFETITIHRDIPIINGYLQLPPNLESDKTKYEVGDNEVTELTGGSGNNTGNIHGVQRFHRLEGIRPDQWYDTDPVENLK